MPDPIVAVLPSFNDLGDAKIKAFHEALVNIFIVRKDAVVMDLRAYLTSPENAQSCSEEVWNQAVFAFRASLSDESDNEREITFKAYLYANDDNSHLNNGEPVLTNDSISNGLQRYMEYQLVFSENGAVLNNSGNKWTKITDSPSSDRYYFAPRWAMRPTGFGPREQAWSPWHGQGNPVIEFSHLQQLNICLRGKYSNFA